MRAVMKARRSAIRGLPDRGLSEGSATGLGSAVMTSPTDPSSQAVRPPAFIYGLIGVVVAVLILGTGAFIWLTQSGSASLMGGPFVLQNGDGRQVTDRDLRGKNMLVYFDYTFFPDVF